MVGRSKKKRKWPTRIFIFGVSALILSIVLAVFHSDAAAAIVAIIAAGALPLAALSSLWSRAIKALRSDSSRLAFPSTIILLNLGVYFFAAAAVFIVAGGDGRTTSAAMNALANQQGLLWFINFVILNLVVVSLFAGPNQLRQRLDFEKASEFTRSSFIFGLNICALVMTASYLLLQHFFRGPLAKSSVGPLIVAILAILALLAPIYRSVIKSVWQYGLADVMDPAAWKAKLHISMEEFANTEPEEQRPTISKDTSRTNTGTNSTPRERPPSVTSKSRRGSPRRSVDDKLNDALGLALCMNPVLAHVDKLHTSLALKCQD